MYQRKVMDEGLHLQGGRPSGPLCATSRKTTLKPRCCFVEQKIELAVQQLRQLGAVHAPCSDHDRHDRRDPVSLNGLKSLRRFGFRCVSSKPVDVDSTSISNASCQPDGSATRASARRSVGAESDRLSLMMSGRFRLKVVAWRGNRWHEHHVDVSPQSRQSSTMPWPMTSKR